MATLFSAIRDKAAYFSNAFPLSDSIFSATIAQNTDTTVTVPSTGMAGMGSAGETLRYVARVKTKGTSLVYIAVNATAAKPVGATFAAVSSEQVTEGWYYVKGGDVIHFLTPDVGGADVTVSFYYVGQ